MDDRRRPRPTGKCCGFLLNIKLTDFNTTRSINPFTGSVGYYGVQPLNLVNQQKAAYGLRLLMAESAGSDI